MIRKKYIIFIFLLFPLLQIVAQQNEPPRLVIGVMIEGMQTNQLKTLMTRFDESGLKLIVKNGISVENMTYNIVSSGNASDIATVMTGSVPFYHGITGKDIYNRVSGKLQSVVTDEQQIGIGTKLMVSAHNLLSSSIVDELMLTYPKKSKSFAVGINPEDVILMGGHSANSIAWIDDVFLKWVTTGYYKNGLSHSADEMNVNGRFERISTRVWEPMNDIKSYLSEDADSKRSSFKYNPADRISKNSSITLLKTTPSANSLVAELGIKLIQDENLGMDNEPDILMLQFTVRTPNEKIYSLQTVEKEDMYLRLDKEIQYMLQRIESLVGLDKTLLFFFGNQMDSHSPTEYGQNKVPAGYFNANRSMALVNTYLMALYGQERWIEGYHSKNIYLNKQKIEEKKLDFLAFKQTVANFMMEFEGIQSAYSVEQILNMGIASNIDNNRMLNSIHKKNAGDIILSLMPGWIEVDDKIQVVGESNSIESKLPLYFYGNKLKSNSVNSPYSAIDIASTLSRILKISTPNASLGKPIVEIIKNYNLE